MKKNLFMLLALAGMAAGQTQPKTGTITATAQCVSINGLNNTAVGIIVSGTWVGTMTPNLQISTASGAPTVNKKVVPVDSTTSQSTITANGGYRATIGGFAQFNVCSTGTWTSGTATVTLYATPAPDNSSVAAAGPSGAAGGDLSGTYPNPTVATVLGGSTPIISLLPLHLTDANTVEQYNSTTAQVFTNYGTRTDASNYERLRFYWGSGPVASIASEAAGTGTVRSIQIELGGSARWLFGNDFTFKPATTNARDIGTTGLRVRTGYFGTSIDNSGSNSAATYLTATNCSSAASPAVCAAASAGSVAVPTGTNPTLTVNTTAVTANSQILLTVDESLGTKLSVTCNTTLSTLPNPVVTARTAATSFTFTLGAIVATNPACISYTIVN